MPVPEPSDARHEPKPITSLHGVIRISMAQAIGLREGIRPYSNPSGSPVDPAALVLLHEKILFALVEFETTEPAPEKVPLILTHSDCMFINQFLSMQDGNWAQDVLRQTRRALYELRTGVCPGWPENNVEVKVRDEDASAHSSGAE